MPRYPTGYDGLPEVQITPFDPRYGKNKQWLSWAGDVVPSVGDVIQYRGREYKVIAVTNNSPSRR